MNISGYSTLNSGDPFDAFVTDLAGKLGSDNTVILKKDLDQFKNSINTAAETINPSLETSERPSKDFQDFLSKHTVISMAACDEADTLIGKLRQKLDEKRPSALLEIAQTINSKTLRINLFLYHKFLAQGLGTFTDHTIKAIDSSSENSYLFLRDLFESLICHISYKHTTLDEAKRFIELRGDKALCALEFSRIFNACPQEFHVLVDLLIRHLGKEKALEEILTFETSFLVNLLEPLVERHQPSKASIEAFDDCLDQQTLKEAPLVGCRLRAMRAMANWNIAAGNNEIKDSLFFEQPQNKILSAFIHKRQMPHHYASYNIPAETVHSFVDGLTQEIRNNAYSHLKPFTGEMRNFYKELVKLADIARLKPWMHNNEPGKRFIDLLTKTSAAFPTYYELKPEDWHNFHFDLCLACLFATSDCLSSTNSSRVHYENYPVLADITARLLSYPHITPNNEAYLKLLLNLKYNPADITLLRAWLNRPERSKGLSAIENKLLQQIVLKYFKGDRLLDYLEVRPFLPASFHTDFEKKHAFSCIYPEVYSPFLAKEMISYHHNIFEKDQEKSIDYVTEAYYYWKDDPACIREIMRFAEKIETLPATPSIQNLFWSKLSQSLYKARHNPFSNRTYKAIHEHAPPQLLQRINQVRDELKAATKDYLIPKLEVAKELGRFDEQFAALPEQECQTLREGHVKTVAALTEEWEALKEQALRAHAAYDFIDTYKNVTDFFEPYYKKFQITAAKIQSYQEQLTAKLEALAKWENIQRKYQKLDVMLSDLNNEAEQLGDAGASGKVQNFVNVQRSRYNDLVSQCKSDDINAWFQQFEELYQQTDLELRTLQDRVKIIKNGLQDISDRFEEAIRPFVSERRIRQEKLIETCLDTSIAVAPAQLQAWKSPMVLYTPLQPKNNTQTLESKNQQLREEIERLKAQLATAVSPKTVMEPQDPYYKGLAYSQLVDMAEGKLEKLKKIKALNLLQQLQDPKKCNKKDMCNFLNDIGITMQPMTGSHQSFSYRPKGNTVQGTNFTLATHSDILDPQGCKDAFAAINIALDEIEKCKAGEPSDHESSN